MMNKLSPLAAALLLSAPLSAAAPPPAPPSFGETVEVNVVNVDVYVTDKNGHRVGGLKKGDFEVLEDGKTVVVSNFAEITPARPAVRETSPVAPSAPGASQGTGIRTDSTPEPRSAPTRTTRSALLPGGRS